MGKTSITVIGLGPIGQALAGAFLKGGHSTTVWNRTADKAGPLIGQGAVRADSVTEAIQAGSIVVICVLNYDAVRSVLEFAGEALAGKILINMTTGSPFQAREMAEWAAGNNIDYIDGVIMTLPPAVGTPESAIMYSGSESAYRNAQSSLASLGGLSDYLGEDPGRASAFDLALIGLFWSSMGGYLHALALAGAEQIGAGQFSGYAQKMIGTLSDLMTEVAKHVDEGHYPGDLSNLHSTVAGLENIIHTSERHQIDAGLLRAFHSLAKRAIDMGYGDEAVSRLTHVLRMPK
ncbi:NAD(P)-binding domain-containing protein [Bifidobacterium pullorum subsp. gallinarum]